MTYTEFRKDGWPLCPRCGEDELWAHGPDMDIDHPPTMQEMIAAIVSCLNCGWRPQLAVSYPKRLTMLISPQLKQKLDAILPAWPKPSSDLLGIRVFVSAKCPPDVYWLGNEVEILELLRKLESGIALDKEVGDGDGRPFIPKEAE